MWLEMSSFIPLSSHLISHGRSVWRNGQVSLPFLLLSSCLNITPHPSWKVCVEGMSGLPVFPPLLLPLLPLTHPLHILPLFSFLFLILLILKLDKPSNHSRGWGLWVDLYPCLRARMRHRQSQPGPHSNKF